jgi:hypothetical protein
VVKAAQPGGRRGVAWRPPQPQPQPQEQLPEGGSEQAAAVQGPASHPLALVLELEYVDSEVWGCF